MKKFDLIIIGGGAAGFSAAMKADELKARTLMVNDTAVGIGGTCVNVGCLPTKHLLHIGELIHKTKAHNFNGLNLSSSFDFDTIIKEKNTLIERLRTEKYEKVLGSLTHVEFVEGAAKFISKSEIDVGGETYSADKYIITTGSSPHIPPIEGIIDVGYITSTEALQLKIPKSMIIIGGGALGIEFAQMFSRFQTKVCLLQRSDRILPREEPELANLLQGYLEGEGIEICTDVKIKGVQEAGSEKIVKAIVNGKEVEYGGKELLIATGRKPNASGLGLEKVGVKMGDKGEIIVNDEMWASENVWAAGDVVGEPMLETVAAKEGMIAANNALSHDEEKRMMDYSVVPRAVFSSPQLAGVGLTDEQAIEKGIKCRCNTIPMELVPKALAIKDTRGAIKIVIDDETQRIVGIQILSSNAADLIHEGVMIIKNKMKIDDVIDTLHVFPTLSEATKIAAQSFRRDITKMSCCVE